MPLNFPAISLGWIIALAVLIIAIVLLVTGLHTWAIILIAALAVARLVP